MTSPPDGPRKPGETPAPLPYDPLETLFPLRRALDLDLFTRAQLEECRRDQEQAHRLGKGYSLTQALLARGWLRPEDMEKLLQDQTHPLTSAPALSRYEIRGWLGEGAAGTVYRGWDRELKRPVAIKVLRDFGRFNESMRRRFRGEAQAAAGLAHPNLVAVHDVGEEDGVLFLVMELVEGSLLSEILGRHGLAPREIARLLEKVCRGVGAAHGRGILHRDLKPGNILVTRDGEPKVFDFGLALVQGETAVHQSSVMAGTPLYMAPEQITARPAELTPATDVYALGAILYEALTGHPPHRAESVGKVYGKVLNELPKPPRVANPGIPRDLETLCLHALEKDPSRRYPNADALAADLKRLLEGEPIQARPLGAFSRALRRVRRHPWGALAAAAAALGLAWTITVAARSHLQRLDAARWAVEGDRSKRQGQWVAALAAYERAYALEPSNRDYGVERDGLAQRTAAEEARLRGQKDAALAALRIREAAQELDKLRLRAYQPLWRITEEDLARHRKFSEDCLALMEGTGPTGEGWWVVGRVHQVFGDDDAALESYARGLQVEPDHGRCLLYRARILIERALLSRVTSIGEPRNAPWADQQVAEAVQLLERGARTQRIPEFDRDLAHAYGRLVRGEPVREFCAEMVRKWSGTDFWEEFHLVRGLGEAMELTRGNDLLSQLVRATSRGAALADAATDALKIRPRFPEALLWRGVARFFSADRDRARGDLDLALEINPRHVNAYFARGYLRIRGDDAAGGIADLTRGLEISPRQGLAHTWRGRARESLGDLPGARADYDRALSIDPLDAMALRSRGALRGREKDFAGALEDLDRVIREYPRYAKAINDRASVRQYGLGDLQGALEDYTRAIELSPRDSGARSRRGDLRRALDQPAGAIEDYTAAIKLNPRSADAFLGRGLARQAVAAREPERAQELLGPAAADLEEALQVAGPEFFGHEPARAALREIRRQQGSAPR